MFQGKIALVTGGSRGIGRAIALRLAREGADVVVNYARKDGAALEVVAEIEAMGRRAIAVKANVGEEADVARLIEEARAFGGLDILIANAASGVIEPLMNATEKHWHWTFNINALGFLHLAQGAAPSMRERGDGTIVALTSAGSSRVIDRYGLVGTSKAALESLVRYLGVELAPMGIVVNAVSPGLVETDAIQYLPETEELLETARKLTPGGRLVRAEDVADVVMFLCSPQARMIVGQTIVVDGGFGLRTALNSDPGIAP